jgi:hypothetical protein
MTIFHPWNGPQCTQNRSSEEGDSRMLQMTLTTSTAGQSTEARPADEQQYGGPINMYLGWQRAAVPSCQRIQ